MRRTLAVFAKEALEASRDRRSAGAVVVQALVGPMVLFLVLALVSRQSADRGPWHVSLEHGEAAPGLEAVLNQYGVIKDQTAAVEVRVPEDAVSLMRNGGTVRVIVTADLTRDEGVVDHIRQALAAYERSITTERLVARGVPSALMHPVAVDVRDTGALDLSSRIIVSSILVILLASPFFGGIALASDATAGERERHSLVPLLVQPVGAGEVAVGKWIAVSVASIVGSLVTVTGSAAVLSQAPVADLGLRLTFGPQQAVTLAILLLPLCLTASAGQLLIALGSKTYKEGQTYLTLLTFLPFVVGFLWSSPLGTKLAGRPLPLFWEMGAIADLMSGRGVSLVHLAPALIGYGLVTALLLLAVMRQLRRAAVTDA
jgi:sodium transport system permease protein